MVLLSFYIFSILVFLFRNIVFISFALAQYALLPFTILSPVSVLILLSALKMEPRQL